MQEVTLVLIAFVSFFGLFFIGSFLQSIRRERKMARKLLLQAKKVPLYFRLHRYLLKDTSLESLLFCASSVQHLLRVCFIVFSIAAFTLYQGTSSINSLLTFDDTLASLQFVLFLLLILLSLILIADFLPRFWASAKAESCLKSSRSVASLFLLSCCPFSLALYKLLQMLLPKGSFVPFSEPKVISKEKLLELFDEIGENVELSAHDKQLLQSVLTFRDRIVREVMVPRVDLFSLPVDCTIKEAGHMLEKEGYSRVPVYKNTQDHIVGMLMYKDVLSKYMECQAKNLGPEFLETPIEEITKKVLYTPETKKISLLLQEFRKKKMHLAVVVDEYGGTAGVVTIEDILEEIVGEIADEYDETEVLMKRTKQGFWIVDGRTNLLDLEEETSIRIPQEGEYDTVAGYLFYRLGTIPKKGVIVHHDDFEMEILDRGDRFVETVKITPLTKGGG